MAPRARLHDLTRLCLTAALWLLASCTPPGEASRVAEGGVVYLDRERDDAGNFVNVLVTVAGLNGSGLTLTIDGTQSLSIPSDGVFHVPLQTPTAEINITVTAQPDQPAQVCEIQKLEETTFLVLCHDQAWVVAGVINGLEGKGLRLALYDEGDTDDVEEGGAHNIFVVDKGGAFQFPRPLQDNVTYRIEILDQPISPHQDCTLSHGEGLAEADVTDVQIDCTTRKYKFITNTVGLKGTGMMMHTEAGDFPVEPGLDFGADEYPDGYVYFTSIAVQPSNPSQVCYVQNGDGVINGAPVNITVVCDAQGGLRIAEVGACPLSSSSCWFEIINTGGAPENLSFYKLRTSALSQSAFVPSRLFTLPQVTLQQYGHVILQGKAPGAMPDGDIVYHLADGTNVPWWSSDGFVELLNPAGATASFLRWGSSKEEPTTGGTYGGGSAPALPRGAAAYGYSLQHPDRPGKMPPSGDEFELLPFATYGGPNDVGQSDDVDNDGIPDASEIPGGSFAGLSMYDMGARTGQRDIFVEIDHMEGVDPALLPRKESLDRVVAAFLKAGIFVHFDVGDLYASKIDPESYNLGGGNAVPFATAVGLAPTDAAIKDLYAIKAQNMAANRRMVFYYQLFAWSQQPDGSGGSSGVGERPGNDSIITLGGFGLAADTLAQRNVLASYQAASIMHELGHNFSLSHGGGDSINRKPNYVSVMNYLYSPMGLPTIGNAEGDRYDLYKRCSISSMTQLTNAPSGDLFKFVIDYSLGTSENLDEKSIRESAGLGRSGSKAVDFNCNGQTDGSSYSRDLNSDGAFDVLADNNDWAALDFVFRRYATGAESGPSLRPELERFDTLTADTSHNLDDPCPAPMVR